MGRKFESVAEEVMHTTQRDRDNYKTQVPPKAIMGEDLRLRPPGCSRPIERRILRESGKKKARAEHLVRCSVMPEKKKIRRKLLKELFIDGNLSENRADVKKELQKHCEAVYVDSEETDQEQRERIQRDEHPPQSPADAEQRSGDVPVGSRAL